MAVTAGAFPDIERRSPITVTGDIPVASALKPVAEASVLNGFGNPVDALVKLY